MARYHSNSLKRHNRQRELKEMLKNNKFLQQTVFILVTIMTLLYAGVLFWQMTKLVAVMEYNRQSVMSDNTLEAVEVFEVLDNGEVNIELKNGVVYKRTEADFVFIPDNNATDEAYYNTAENVIIKEVSEDFWWDILKGNKYPIVLCATLFIIVYFAIMRRHDWVYFSKKHTLGVSIGVAILVLFDGLFALIMF